MVFLVIFWHSPEVYPDGDIAVDHQQLLLWGLHHREVCCPPQRAVFGDVVQPDAYRELERFSRRIPDVRYGRCDGSAHKAQSLHGYDLPPSAPMATCGLPQTAVGRRQLSFIGNRIVPSIGRCGNPLTHERPCSSLTLPQIHLGRICVAARRQFRPIAVANSCLGACFQTQVVRKTCPTAPG